MSVSSATATMLSTYSLALVRISFDQALACSVSSVADAAPHSSTGLAIFTDRTPRILADSGNSEAAELLSTRPYEVETLGGGYMLKSLMRGNPLEKQIGKNGTVSVNNVRALVGKGSKVEQAVVDKVLASEEFAKSKEYLALNDYDVTYSGCKITATVDRLTNEITRLEFFKAANVTAYMTGAGTLESYGDVSVMFTLEDKAYYEITWDSGLPTSPVETAEVK